MFITGTDSFGGGGGGGFEPPLNTPMMIIIIVLILQIIIIIVDNLSLIDHLFFAVMVRIIRDNSKCSFVFLCSLT